ncbi:hypothetical protein BH09ACT6_BH09ACT6_18740 [soil metagenome]
MTVFVDVRAAGGTVRVSPGEDFLGDDVVILELPGYQVDCAPNEARKLARALIEVAAAAEQGESDADWLDEPTPARGGLHGDQI